RRHTRFSRDWSSDVCSSDLMIGGIVDVEYTNTSDPLDPAFIYQWDYKEDVVSVEETGTEIGGMFFDRKLQYSSDKQRDITLTVKIGRASCREKRKTR